MNAGTIEVYRPRDVSVLGDWDIGGLKLKAYGLAAVGRHVDDAMVVFAPSFVRQDVISRVAAEGDSDAPPLLPTAWQFVVFPECCHPRWWVANVSMGACR